jgi:hypothetical protein
MDGQRGSRVEKAPANGGTKRINKTWIEAKEMPWTGFALAAVER